MTIKSLIEGRPDELETPSRSSLIDDSNDFVTANGDSPAPTSPIASPAPYAPLHSALTALGSPEAPATPTPAPVSHPQTQALQSLNNDDALIEGVSEIDADSLRFSVDSLTLSPDSIADSIHGNANLFGTVPLVATRPEAQLAAPVPRAALTVRAEDDGLRPLQPGNYPIPPVVNRTPARNIEEIEARAVPPLYPQEQPSQLRTLGNSLFGFLGRIPGMQTLGNLALAVPGTQTILTQLGLLPADLPGARAPRLPQIQHPIPGLGDGTPDHIAIDIPREQAEEVEARERSFTVIPQHNTAPASAFSQVARYVQQIMAPQQPARPQPLLPTHQTSASERNQEIYRQLGIQPRLNPLATILGEGQQLTPARVRVTHGGRTAISASAQGDRDMVQSTTSRPTAPQLTPFEQWHQTAPAAALVPVDPALLADQPSLLGSAITIGTSAVNGMALLLQNPPLAGEKVRTMYMGFMSGFSGAPATPASAAAPSTQPRVLNLLDRGMTLAEQIVPHVQAGLTHPEQAGAAVGRLTQSVLAGVTGAPQPSLQPSPALAPTTGLDLADVLRPEQPAPTAGPSTLSLLDRGMALAEQIVPHVQAGLTHPEQAGAAVGRLTQSILAGVTGAPAPSQQPSPALAPTGLDLTQVLGPQQQAAAPSATAHSLMETATTLLGSIARVIRDPYQAGRDGRTVVGDLFTGATGGERRDPSASAAAPAETTTAGFFSQLFRGLKDTATKKFTEAKLKALACTLAQKVTEMDASPAKNQINAMIAAIARFQANEISLDALQATLTKIMDGLDASGKDILHFHLNGFELHIRTEKPGEAQGILEATQAAHPLLPQPAQIDVKLKQAQLVNNISTMQPMTIINARLCDGILKPADIAEILGKADRRSDNYHSVVRKEFYAAIDKIPNLMLPKKWAAKLVYWAISGLSSTVLSSFITGLLGKIETSVQHDNRQQQQEIHTAVITGLNRSLDVYNRGVAAVKEARRVRPVDGVILSDHDTELGNELARPPYNEGETKETMYNKAIDKAINEVLPPLGWTQNIQNFFTKLPIAVQIIGWTPPFTLLTLIAWGGTFFIELGFNSLIRTLLRNLVKDSKILDSVIDLSVDQVARNGYSHAINKFVLQQLKLIGEALDKNDSVESAPSVANRNELKKLAKALFTTLETQRRDAQVNTDDVTTLENVRRSIYQLTSDFSADAIALIIDQSKNVLLDPNTITLRQDALLEALNAALESRNPTTPEEIDALEKEMLDVEKEIQKQSDILLNKALKKIVHQTIENTPEQVQKASKGFTDKLEKTAAAFVTQIRGQLEDPIKLESSIAQFTSTMRGLLNEAQNDPLLENYAGTIDQSLITPIAKLLSDFGTAITAGVPRPMLEASLTALETCIKDLPKISSIDATIMGSVIENLEGITTRTAFIAGKEFFNEAWGLLTKKPVWRFAAHRAMLAFIKS